MINVYDISLICKNAGLIFPESNITEIFAAADNHKFDLRKLKL